MPSRRPRGRPGGQSTLLAAAPLLALGLLLVPPSQARAEDAQKGLEAVQPTSAADAYYERGARALRQGDTEKAIQELAIAARLAPDDPSILSAYAQALVQAGRQDEAVQILQRARGTRSVDEDLALGVVSFELKRWDEAAAHLRRAVQREPDNGAAHLFLASALIETGAYEEAIAELEKARAADEWLAAEVESRLGRIELERGNKASAEEHFRAAERLAPATLLGELARQTVGRPEPRRWSAYGTVGMAYDTNVNLGGDDVVLSPDGENDWRVFAEAGIDYDLVVSDRFNLRVGTVSFISRHTDRDLREFDLLTTRAFGVAAFKLTESLTADARYTFEYIWNDFDDFRRTHLVEPSLRWRPRQDLLSRAFYRYESRDFFTSLDAFPTFALPPPFDKTKPLQPYDRDGYLQFFGVEQYWFPPDWTGWGRGFVRVGYRHRQERTDGSDNDANGHIFSALVGAPLPWQLYLLLDVEYERRNYEEPTSIGLLFQGQENRRKDRIWRTRVTLRRPITDHLTAEVGYLYNGWDSNADFFAFDRHIVQFLVTYRY